MWQRENGYDAVWRVCGVEGMGIVEGISGMSVPVFLSFHLPSSQRHTMPYRGGGHSTAAAISSLGGESNYVDGPRRRRPPPVSLSTPSPSSRPPWHLLLPVLRHPLRSILFTAHSPTRRTPFSYSLPLVPLSRTVRSRHDRSTIRWAPPAEPDQLLRSAEQGPPQSHVPPTSTVSSSYARPPMVH